MTCQRGTHYSAAATIQPIFCGAASSFCGAALDFGVDSAEIWLESGWTPQWKYRDPPSGNIDTPSVEIKS